MQFMRSYSGEFERGSTASIQYQWGDASATQTVYPAVTEFFNQTVADFLNECGITSAAYEARAGDTQKWLYIYDVPCLFLEPSNSSAQYFSIPKMDSYSSFGSLGAIGPNADPRAYNFSLYFAGSNTYGFQLRGRNYSGSTPYNAGVFVLPCTNVTTNGRGIAFIGGSTNYYNVVDVVGGKVDLTHLQAQTLSYVSSGFSSYFHTRVNASIGMRNAANGKFPLIPVFIGTYRMNGLYQYVANFDIPLQTGATVVNQAEFAVGNRQFISFYADKTSVESAGSIGVLETTSA